MLNYTNTHENLSQLNQHETDITPELQQHITRAVNQAIHDIQSPLLCLLIQASYHKPRSSKKIDSKELFNRINTIIHNIPETIKNICGGYQPKHNQIINIITHIEKIISEKQFEYSNSKITFRFNSANYTNSIFIIGNINSFERMLSNLLNNAAEACNTTNGMVSINLNVDNNFVHMVIEDNGIGMHDEVKYKILNKIKVTANKINGHGIGFGQIQETLAASDSKLAIESQVGLGTKITLSFPKIMRNIRES